MTNQQVESLEVVIKANADQFKSELKKVTKQLKIANKSIEGFGGQMNKTLNAIKGILIETVKDTDAMSNAMVGGTKQSSQSMMKMGAVAGAVGGLVAKGFQVALSAVKKLAKALKDIVVQSTEYAMNAVESETLVARVFGEQTEAITEWSNQLGESLGLNAYEVRKNAATLYTMAHSIGATSEQALTLAKNFTQLSTDMSAFYNISEEDAFTKLRSGITGETEPLRKLGIIITQTMVKDAAYRHGIAQTGEELSEQQKVLGRYMTVMEQTAIAQGAWHDELMNPIVALRVLGNQIKQVAIDFGSLFLPILAKIIPYLQAFVYILRQAVSALASVFGSMGIQVADFGDQAESAYDKATEGAESAAGGAKKLKEELLGLAGFDEMNVLTEKDESGAGGGGGGIGAGADAFELPDFGEIFGDMENKAKEIGERIINYLKDLFKPLVTIWELILEPAIAELRFQFNKLIETLGQSEVFKTIMQIFIAIGGVIVSALINSITSVITVVRIFFGVLDAMAKFIGWVVWSIVGLFTNTKQTWEIMMEDIKNFFIDTWDSIVEYFERVWSQQPEVVREAGEKIWGFVQDTWNSIWEFIDGIAKDLYDAIYDFVYKAVLKFFEIRAKVMFIFNYLKGFVQYKMDEIRNNISSRINSIKNFFVGIWDTAKWVFSSIGNWIWDKMSSAINRVKSLMDGLKTKFSGFFINIANLIKTPINSILGRINSIIYEMRTWRIPLVAPNGIYLPDIPLLARGGIVGSPTLAMLGESGKEAVVPLENNTEWIDKLASKIGGSGEIHLTVKVGDDVVGEKVIDYISDKNMRTNLNTINI